MRMLFLGALLALAPAVPAHSNDLTEEGFLAALDESHPAVGALGDDLVRAEAARQRAGTLDNPRIEFWREQPDGDPRITNWTVAWTPPLDGRFRLGKQTAAAGVAASREQLAADRAQLRQQMRRAFADWSLAHARCALLSDRLDRVAALAEHERQRARVGAESGLSARRLSLAEAEVRALLRQAEAQKARSEAEVRAWLPDLPPDRRPAPAVLASPPAEVDAAGSPGVRSAERQLEQAQLEARMAGRFWGFPTLQAGVQRVEDSGAVRTGPILAAGWSVPLFDRNQGTRVETRRREEIAASRLRHTQALARAEIQGGLTAYRSLFSAVREAQEASAGTDRVIEAATAAYRAGEASLTDLLDALRSASETRLRELDLCAQALTIHRDLEVALGRPLTAGGSR